MRDELHILHVTHLLCVIIACFVCAADNHAHYDSLQGLYPWAKETLQAHAADKRPRLFTLAQLESAHTHDDLWNAAQLQMTQEGKMHVSALHFNLRSCLLGCSANPPPYTVSPTGVPAHVLGQENPGTPLLCSRHIDT